MQADDRALLHDVVQTLGILARNLETNDCDIASLRLVNQALLKVLANNQQLVEPFAVAIAHAMSADKAVLLNTDVRDEVLEERADGVLRLLPLPVRNRVLLMLK